MATVLFAAYVLYFYAPDLVFRFGASSVYGLRVVKNHSQVQEFFAAGLPSIFLNSVAFVIFNIGWLLLRQRWFLPNLKEITPLLGKDPTFSHITGRELIPPILYIGTVYLFAVFFGWAYGEELREIALAGGLKQRFATRPARYAFFRFWYLFYSTYHDPMYPVVLRKSVAYVHTKETIFYGTIYQLDKDPEGENEGVYLAQVSKYNRAEQDVMLKRGENPITQMSGPIYIKWSEIADINYPIRPDDTLERKRLYFEDRIKNAPYQTELPLRYDEPVN